MQSTEKRGWKTSGFGVLALHLVLVALFVYGIVLWTDAFEAGRSVVWPAILTVGTGLLSFITPFGYFTQQPNEAKVIIFLGHYSGSVRVDGFGWTNPFALKKRISLRVRNFNSETLKVNDSNGNPIEIAAVVVWRVVDSARATFDVDDYVEFVSIQSETALRSLTSHYPYDSHGEPEISLRANLDEVSATLKKEVEARLVVAGVEVIEARLSHLAYAPEIAQAMLRRQQAQAIIAARKQIVEGAVGMVQMALERLSEQKIVQLDEERKATMVNNLLVVLTSEQQIQPVLNSGTLY